METINREPTLATAHKASILENVPEHLIRELIREGRIRWVPAGNRRYVVLQSLREYLYGKGGDR